MVSDEGVVASKRAREPVGRRVRRRQRALGLSQGRVAELASISASHYSVCVRGRKPFRRRDLEAIAAALGIDVLELVEGTDAHALFSQGSADTVSLADHQAALAALAHVQQRSMEAVEHARLLEDQVRTRSALCVDLEQRIFELESTIADERARRQLADEQRAEMRGRLREAHDQIAKLEETNLALSGYARVVKRVSDEALTRERAQSAHAQQAYRELYGRFAQLQVNQQLALQAPGENADSAALVAGVLGLGLGALLGGSSRRRR